MRSPSRWVSLPARAGAALLLLGCCALGAQTPQEHVHHMSHTVMPFDMAKTLHVFAMDDSGGVMRVVARDPGDTEQIELIRRHLEHEAGKFQKGDYSDPAALHGADMPGLKELRAGASEIEVSYQELPDGAAISFRTKDLHLVTSVHRWFGAQLSEHGSDAQAE